MKRLNLPLIFAWIIICQVLVIQPVVAQKLLLENPIEFGKRAFNTGSISSAIVRHKKFYEPEQINDLRNQIIDFNSGIDRKIRELESRRDEYVEGYQNIIANESVSGIQLQIDAKLKSYKTIKEDMREELKKIAYRSLYIAVCSNIGVLDSDNELIKQAKRAITPRAIKENIGSYISSLTQYKQAGNLHTELYKYIKEEVKGQVNPKRKVYGHKFNISKMYVYVSKVETMPLHQHIATQSGKGTSNSNIKLINVLQTNNWRSQMQQLDIPEQDKERLIKEIELAIGEVKADNRAEKNRESKMLQTANQNYIKLMEEILELEQKKKKAEQELKRVIEEYTKVYFDKENVLQTIKKAKQELTQKIQKKDRQIKQAETSGLSRVLRGAGWNNDAKYCRSAFRNRSAPANSYNNGGFRLVRAFSSP